MRADLNADVLIVHGVRVRRFPSMAQHWRAKARGTWRGMPVSFRIGARSPRVARAIALHSLRVYVWAMHRLNLPPEQAMAEARRRARRMATAEQLAYSATAVVLGCQQQVSRVPDDSLSAEYLAAIYAAAVRRFEVKAPDVPLLFRMETGIPGIGTERYVPEVLRVD